MTQIMYRKEAKNLQERSQKLIEKKRKNLQERSEKFTGKTHEKFIGKKR
jgi:hypothetical protein